MSNKRLVCFGCSITKGTGLPDVVESDECSMYAWPTLLADKLKIECRNKGHGGASNKQITHDIFRFNFKENDVVIILWSHANRYVFFKDENNYKTFIPANTGKLARYFYKLFWYEYDGVYSSLVHMHAVNRYLEKLNIKYYNFSLDIAYIEGIVKNKVMRNLFNNVDLQSIDFKPYREYGRCPDGHPNELAHSKFAEAIFPLIKI